MRTWVSVAAVAWIACNNIPTETTTSALIGPAQIRYPKGLYVNPHKTDVTGSDYYNDVMAELANDSISGINVGANWSEVQPDGPDASKSDWTKFQGVFDAVNDWNTANPYNQKTVKAGVHGGFGTPTWALNKIVAESGYCDDVPPCAWDEPEPGCSVGMFIPTEPGFGSAARALPLPWDPLYQKLWATFVGQFAAQWGDNSALAAVWIDGPTAVSSEMIEPTGASPEGYNFGVNVPEWQQALCEGNQQNSTQSFVQPWETAIDLYGSSFTNTTLLLITGATFTNSGLPLLGSPIPMGAGFPSTYAPGEDGYCTDASSPTPNNDCAAETQILAHFINPTVGGNNDKATLMQGMYYGCDANPSLGVHGVKLLTLQTEYTTYPVTGGVAYISPVSDPCAAEGSTCGPPGNCSCKEAPAGQFTDVMSQAFKNTNAAPIYSATQDYIAPLNFIDVFPADLDWIAAHPAMGSAFEQAASALIETAETPYEPPPWEPPYCPTPPCI